PWSFNACCTWRNWSSARNVAANAIAKQSTVSFFIAGFLIQMTLCRATYSRFRLVFLRTREFRRRNGRMRRAGVIHHAFRYRVGDALAVRFVAQELIFERIAYEASLDEHCRTARVSHYV